MTKEPTSIDFRCSNCDHPLVTLPLDYHFSGPLICPGCGETFELPESVEDLLKERRKTEEKKEPGESSD
jgi:uncharacterized Zn finger protein (UPF0148 family)